MPMYDRMPTGRRTSQRLRGYAARDFAEYPRAVEELRQLAVLGAAVPADLQRLVDVAEAVAPLAQDAADQAAAAAPLPDPGETLRRLVDGDDPKKVTSDVQRAAGKSTTPAAIDQHWEAVLVQARTRAARAIITARPGTLIQALQPPHQAACAELADLTRQQPSIVSLTDETALRAVPDARDAYLRAQDLLGHVAAIEDLAAALRGSQEPPQRLLWHGLTPALEAGFRRAVVAAMNTGFGGWGAPAQPSFLACLAAGAVRLLPTRAELQQLLADHRAAAALGAPPDAALTPAR